MPQSEYITLKQFAGMSGESKATIQRRVSAGTIPTVKLGGDLGAHLIERSVAQRLLRERKARLEAELRQVEQAADDVMTSTSESESVSS